MAVRNVGLNEFVPKTNTYDWWFGPNFKAERAERKVWQDFTRANSLFISTAIQLNNEQSPVFNWLTQKLIVLIPGAGVDFNLFLSLNLLREETGKEKDHAVHACGGYRDRSAGAAGRGSACNHTNRCAIAWWRKCDWRLQPAGRHTAQHQNNCEFVRGTNVPTQAKKFRSTLATNPTAHESCLNSPAAGYVPSNATLFVDELDRSLHPHMTRFLVGLFHSRTNDKNSQLVFTTHDTTLLDTDLLRRDQIWFVEKDKQRSSHFYSLLDYSPRKDEALERGYLKGRYGAIPFIGNLGV